MDFENMDFSSDDEGTDLDEVYLQRYRRDAPNESCQSVSETECPMPPKRARGPVSQPACHNKPSTSAQTPRDDGEQLQSRKDAVVTETVKKTRTTRRRISTRKETDEIQEREMGEKRQKSKRGKGTTMKDTGKDTEEMEESTEKTKSKKKRTRKRKSVKHTATPRSDSEEQEVLIEASVGKVVAPRTKKGKSRTRSTAAGKSNLRNMDTDAERIRLLRENRKKKMKEDISKMPRQQIEDLLFRTVERRPGMVFDLMQSNDGGAAPPSPPPPVPDPQVPWCTCGNCKDMPTDAEKLCCGKQPDECLNQHAVFQLITDEACLLLQRAMWVDAYNLEGEPEEPGQENRGMRHAGYRSYVFWQHGRLGQGNRKVIPSCCVSSIRRMYPSVTGVYTGYMPGRFV